MAQSVAAPASRSSFVLYVEGPSDRDLIRAWARTVSHHVARALDERFVILGGRQPARAVDHLQGLGGIDAGVSGLCVLDRDNNHGSRRDPDVPGLEMFVWPRRHIESYLLVPEAIRRCAGLPDGDGRVVQLLAQHVPSGADGLRNVDAKRLLGRRGPIVEALGPRVTPARIARHMRIDELHEDVRDLVERVRAGII